MSVGSVAIRVPHLNSQQVPQRNFIEFENMFDVSCCQLRVEPTHRSPAHFEHVGCGSSIGISHDDRTAHESIRAGSAVHSGVGR